MDKLTDTVNELKQVEKSNEDLQLKLNELKKTEVEQVKKRQETEAENEAMEKKM